MTALFYLLFLIVANFADDDSDRIVGGDIATRGEFPWQVSLQIYDSHACAGSLIDPYWVVTAAHCVDGITTAHLTIKAGIHDLHKFEGSVTEHKVSKIIKHENYNNIKVHNDIALLKLSNPVVKSEHSDFISLPKSNPVPGTLVTVSGWGKLREGGVGSSVLQKVTLSLISNVKCRQTFGTSSILAGMMCAGYEGGGKDACQGDSGGPAVQNKTLVGIVSWSIGCARPNYPGVYTDVYVYNAWLTKKML